MTDLRGQLNRLIEVLQLLAAAYDVQRAALPDFAQAPDEIASNLDDVLPFIDQLTVAGMLNPKQVRLIEKIDAIFARKSEGDTPSFWTLDAMRDDHEWAAVRALARKALHALQQPLRPPNLSWLHYVPGH
jgi:hypothetical protein